MIDFYNNLREKEKKREDRNDYVFDGLNLLSEMFLYKRGDDKLSHIEDRTIELILCSEGNIMFAEHNGRIDCGFGYDGGVRDVNGVGTVITGNMLNGEGLRGMNNIDCVFAYNNAMRQPDYSVVKFADMLTEIDTSLRNGILYAREFPIYETDDQTNANKVEALYKEAKNGSSLAVVKKNSGMVGDNSKAIQRVDLTDAGTVDRLQYLEQLHNSILRRAFTKYGQALSEGTKQAQQSVAETSSNVPASFIIPLDRLRQRQEMCRKLKKVFDINISVEFSEPWQLAYSAFLMNLGARPNNDITDELQEGATANES